METGNSAAGDGNEQYREQIVFTYCKPCKCRCLECCGCRVDDRCADDTDYSSCHHKVKQEGTQVISGLQQNPYRCYRSDHDVNKNKRDPEILGQIQRERKADTYACRKENNTEYGSYDHRSILSVYKKTEYDGKRNKQQGSCCNGAVAGRSAVACADKGVCHDIRKRCDNKEQYQPCKYGKQYSCSSADILLNYFAKGHAFMTNGYKNGTEILNCAEENTTDHNPEETGYPAEKCCLNRSVNRAGTGDR